MSSATRLSSRHSYFPEETTAATQAGAGRNWTSSCPHTRSPTATACTIEWSNAAAHSEPSGRRDTALTTRRDPLLRKNEVLFSRSACDRRPVSLVGGRPASCLSWLQQRPTD